ncbi:hypothetical protein OSB04_010883 [Centaurea solstitialis]|uniref:ABC1 family protein n=1 Tax=Centaurea solstitialis TaxID=347529 RepID=A0AA38TA42_9ASTR|nr:hypothetical protein OSB04_010883 [Centaurea solstitialis]
MILCCILSDYSFSSFVQFCRLDHIKPLVARSHLMGWGSIYIRRMKVFSLALLIYLDYKSLKQREKWTNASDRANLWEKAHERNANRIVKLIIELEGMWVKMGQYFSVRADGLPGAYPRLLKQLQDSLPPRCLKEVRSTIQKELGKSVDDLFTTFYETPLATASIAQVHRATLRDGQEVVVKVQHEGIKTIILEDLKDAKSVVEWIVWAEPKFNFNPVIDEWCKEAPKELDFNREAENTRKVSKNLGCKGGCVDKKPEHRVKVMMPEVIQSTERVLILEYMDGVRLNDSPALDSLGVDKRNIVEEITRAYAHQIFIDGFFNADPHPGNFLVTKSSPHHPILLDFGFTKLLTSSTKHAVAKMFLASAELDAFSGEIILFLRVLNLLAGLSTALNVSVSYYRIIRPFAEFALDRFVSLSCFSDTIEGPVHSAEWIYDSPVNSHVESKLRTLLVKLRNDDKILGIQVCAYKDGEVIIDTAAGVLGNYDPSPVQPDTLFPVFSVTKGVTAGILHWLVDRGLVKFEENVAHIWPEFSSNRKDLIKVLFIMYLIIHLVCKMLLASLVQDNPMLLCDWDECLKRIATVAPETNPVNNSYIITSHTVGSVVGSSSMHQRRSFKRSLLRLSFTRSTLVGSFILESLQAWFNPSCIFLFYVSCVESRLATLTLDTNDLSRFYEISSPRASSCSSSSFNSSSIFQVDVLAGLVPLFNTLNVRPAILPAANGHFSARALPASMPPLSTEKVFDSFLGLGDYKKLTFPDGKFGLGFKRVCSTNGSLIGFGHAGLGGSTAYCDIGNRFAISVTLNKLSFGSVTRDIIQLVCSELELPIPEDYADSGLAAPIN